MVVQEEWINMSAENKDRDIALVTRIATELSEQFDSVRIFVSRHDGKAGTCRVSIGRGNFYAQYGQIREWLIEQEAIASRDAEHEKDDE